MRVLLVAPSIQGAFKPIPKPPLGLAYIAAVLEKDGHEVNIFDMYSKHLEYNPLILKCQEFKPNVIGFSVLTPYMPSVNKYANEIKKFFDIPVVIGGPHPSSIPERILKENSSVDIAVVGEGEETVRELIQTLEGNKNLSEVNGIVYRDNGEITINPERQLIEDIDKIPFPAWHLLGMELYLNALSSKRTFHIITTRGCPGRCTFCDSHRVWQRKIRIRGPSNIVEEIKQLKSKYRMESFIIQDDTFVINKKRAHEFCDLLIQEGLNLIWSCNGRVNLVDKDILEKMKKAGCVHIDYGIESGSQEILDYVKKGISIDQIRRAVRITKEVGMGVGGFFMMGFPPETDAHIKKTVEFAKELDLDFTTKLSMLVPYPGTEIYHDLKKEGLLLDEDWGKYFKVPDPGVYVEPSITTRFLSAQDLLRIKKETDRELNRYIYKKILKKQFLRSHMLLRNFIDDPKAFVQRATRFVHAMIKGV